MVDLKNGFFFEFIIMYFQGLQLFCCFDRNRKQIATCKFEKIQNVDVHDIYLIFDRDMDIIAIRLIKICQC